MVSSLLFTAFAVLAAAAPAEKRAASLPPKWTSKLLGNTTSNFPNIYRDGGGGGQINGINFMIFSDGIYTNDGQPPKPNFANWANFSSNSIAASGYDGKGPLSLMDFGNAQKGPLQQIPYFYNNGEDDTKTGIWPNNGITTLLTGPDKGLGILFPQVVNRTGLSTGHGTLYNTGVLIGVGGFGPIVKRPVQKMFLGNQIQYGLFGTLAGIDGYLYMYAPITNTTNSNGLKMARVPQSSWSDLTQFQYWNGAAYQSTPPAYDDNGRANIFNYTQINGFNGDRYGPGTGDLFWNSFYSTYLLIFQPGAAALDSRAYITYSSDMTKGWSTPQVLYDTHPLSDGYNYALHAYPNYDSSGRVIPLSWSQYSQSQGYLIGMANITFS